jgi:hypothetical protein
MDAPRAREDIPRIRMMLRRLSRLLAWTLAAVFAVATVFFYVKTRERSHLLDAFIDESLVGVDRRDTDAVVHALALAVYQHTNRGVSMAELPLYERLEAVSFFNVTTGTSLKHGIYGVTDHGVFGPCGTMSRVLLNALWEIGIPARKLQLLAVPGSGHIQHTMVEYRVGDRWQVISPSDSAFVWRNRAGQVATVTEIRSDPAVFDQVHAWHAWWPADFEHTSNIRWEKLPAPARRVARALLGEHGYASAETPRLYEQPRRLFFLASLAMALLSALVAWWLGRGGRRGGPAAA